MTSAAPNAVLAPGAPVATQPTTGTTPNRIAARGAAEDFESFFLSQSLESMFAGVETNSLFGGGQGETVYRSLMLQEYGKIAARSGGVGIADAVQRQMLSTQEVKG
jgi:Rod binding domain-containing protein